MMTDIGIVGGGMIGIGLAALFTGNGISCVVYIRHDSEKLLTEYNNCFNGLIDAGYLTSAYVHKISRLLRIVTDYSEFKNIEYVFEAVSENIETKKSVYKQIEKYAVNIKVLSSTSSAITANALADCLTDPSIFVIAHPFHPVWLIPCVEIVPGVKTTKKTIQLISQLLNDVGKKPILIRRDIPGFVANRLQYALLREGLYLVENNIATPEEIDQIIKFSFIPRYTEIGLFEHFDNCGLELTMEICNRLFPDLSNMEEAPSFIEDLCRGQKFGVESGQGIFQWDRKSAYSLKKRSELPYYHYFSWHLPDRT